MPRPPLRADGTGRSRAARCATSAVTGGQNGEVAGPSFDLDHPPRSSWVLAAAAGAVAIAGTIGLWWLADSWSDEPSRTNAYTLIAALVGVVIFEFGRYAATVKSRHRQAVEAEFRLRDVRAEEVRHLLEQVETNQQVLNALEREIRLRVERATLQARRDLVEASLLTALEDYDAIRHAQSLVDTPEAEPNLDPQMAARVEAAIAEMASAEQRQDLGRRILEATLESLPLGVGSIALAVLRGR